MLGITTFANSGFPFSFLKMSVCGESRSTFVSDSILKAHFRNFNRIAIWLKRFVSSYKICAPSAKARFTHGDPCFSCDFCDFVWRMYRIFGLTWWTTSASVCNLVCVAYVYAQNQRIPVVLWWIEYTQHLGCSSSANKYIFCFLHHDDVSCACIFALYSRKCDNIIKTQIYQTQNVVHFHLINCCYMLKIPINIYCMVFSRN